MLEVRFLKSGERVGTARAGTLKEARERAKAECDDADKAVIVKEKPDGSKQHLEVQDTEEKPGTR